MQYKIVSNSDNTFRKAQKGLEDWVNADLEDGWKPKGGVSMFYNHQANMFIASQAMIKDE